MASWQACKRGRFSGSRNSCRSLRRHVRCNVREEVRFGFRVPLELDDNMRDETDLEMVDFEHLPTWAEIWGDLNHPSKVAMYEEQERLVEQYLPDHSIGETVVGTVTHVEPQGAQVAIGGKGPAFAPVATLTAARCDDAREVLRPGMIREWYIDREYKGTFQLVANRAHIDAMWSRMRIMKEFEVVLPCEILNVNNGGIQVGLYGFNFTGFVPNTHLGELADVEDRDALIGSTIEVKFLDIDEEIERVTLSANRLLFDDKAFDYEIGDVIEGTVTKVQLYGAFVDCGGGVQGLLHLSQISHDHVEYVEDVMTVGDQLKVMVISIERDRGRLGLSTRKLEPSPGDMLRNPAYVFDNAVEMAKLFKLRVSAAEEAAVTEEALQAQGLVRGMPADPAYSDPTLAGQYGPEGGYALPGAFPGDPAGLYQGDPAGGYQGDSGQYPDPSQYFEGQYPAGNQEQGYGYEEGGQSGTGAQ